MMKFIFLFFVILLSYSADFWFDDDDGLVVKIVASRPMYEPSVGRYGSTNDAGYYNSYRSFGYDNYWPKARSKYHAWKYQDGKQQIVIHGGIQYGAPSYDDLWWWMSQYVNPHVTNDGKTQWRWSNGNGPSSRATFVKAGKEKTTSTPYRNQKYRLLVQEDYTYENTPGGRYGGTHCNLNGEEFILYGGVDQNKGNGVMADLWLYQNSIEDWAFWRGDWINVNQPGYVPVANEVFSNNNTMGRIVEGNCYTLTSHSTTIFYGGHDNGGQYSSNVWAFQYNTGQFALMRGTVNTWNTALGYGGSPNVFDASNEPYARAMSTMWPGQDGDSLYIFGGRAYDLTNTKTFVSNDMWIYDYNLNHWKFVGGKRDSDSLAGVYGTRFQYDPSNWPGGREEHGVDLNPLNSSEVIMHGGLGMGLDTTIGLLNDFWYFDMSRGLLDGEWTYLGPGTTGEGINVNNVYNDNAKQPFTKNIVGNEFRGKYRYDINKIGGARGRRVFFHGDFYVTRGKNYMEIWAGFGRERWNSNEYYSSVVWNVNYYAPHMCYGKWSDVGPTEDNGCGTRANKGRCIGLDSCQCDHNNWGRNCHTPMCYGIRHSSSNPIPCSNHGVGQFEGAGPDYGCVEQDTCVCRPTPNTGYFGYECQYWNCSSIRMDHDLVCSDHGTCTDPDICDCDALHHGPNTDCQYPKCNSIPHDDDDVCEGHGTCYAKDSVEKGHEHLCACQEGYYTYNCGKWNCFHIPMNSPATCSGEGTCEEPDWCICRAGNEGGDCSNDLAKFLLVLSIVGASVGLLIGFIVVIALTAVGIFVFYKVYQKVKTKEIHWRKFEVEDDEGTKTLTELAEDEFTEAPEDADEGKKEDGGRGRGRGRVRRVRRVRGGRRRVRGGRRRVTGGVRRVRGGRRVRRRVQRGRGMQQMGRIVKNEDDGAMLQPTVPSLRGNVQQPRGRPMRRRVVRGRPMRRRVTRGRPMRRRVTRRPMRRGRPRGRRPMPPPRI